MLDMAKQQRMEYVTARRYAAIHETPYTTVMKWLQAGLIEGVIKKPLEPPFVGYVYQIPMTSKPPELKPGPKPKIESEKIESEMKAGDVVQTSVQPKTKAAQAKVVPITRKSTPVKTKPVVKKRPSKKVGS